MASQRASNERATSRFYLDTLAMDATGKSRVRWSNRWKAAMNALDTVFDGRLSLGLL